MKNKKLFDLRTIYDWQVLLSTGIAEWMSKLMSSNIATNYCSFTNATIQQDYLVEYFYLIQVQLIDIEYSIKHFSSLQCLLIESKNS